MESILEKLEREEIKLADFEKRIWAFVIDDLIIAVLFFVIYYPKFSQIDPNDSTAILNLVASLVLYMYGLKVIYHTFFVWRYGASLGKIAMKIICLDAVMLSTPSLSKSFARACVRVLSEVCYYLGFAWAFGNKQRQTWQDKLANTIVCEVKNA